MRVVGTFARSVEATLWVWMWLTVAEKGKNPSVEGRGGELFCKRTIIRSNHTGAHVDRCFNFYQCL